MPDIFISYKREDDIEKGRVRPIVEALRAEGFEVFYDVQIPPGSTWEQILQGKINEAKVVLTLWSSTSVQSDWVKEEAQMAKSAGKLIPVLLDPVNPPFGFSRIEAADLTRWDGQFSHSEWQGLVRAVTARIGERTLLEPAISSVPYQSSDSSPKLSGTGNGGRSGSWLTPIISILIIGGVGGGGYFVATQTDLLTAATAKDSQQAVKDDKSENPTAAGTGTGPQDEATSPSDIDELRERRFAHAKTTDTIEAWKTFISLYSEGDDYDFGYARYKELFAAEQLRDRLNNTYNLKLATLSNFKLSPTSPSILKSGEKVRLTFDKQAVDGAYSRTFVFADPNWDAALGDCSRKMNGLGEFWFEGSGCSGVVVNKIRLTIDDGNNGSKEQIEFPVNYRVE